MDQCIGSVNVSSPAIDCSRYAQQSRADLEGLISEYDVYTRHCDDGIPFLRQILPGTTSRIVREYGRAISTPYFPIFSIYNLTVNKM
jgi:hypothetical protein